MGFLDKVKAMKNVVTGGAAKVYLDSETISYSEPFKVTIRAETGDSPVKISRVYLYVKAREQVSVPDVDVMYDDNGNESRRMETVRASHETVNLDITVASGLELEANQTFEWEVEVELPSDAPTIYNGRFCEHTYRAFAGLDCFGNDPDSGWVDLHD